MADLRRVPPGRAGRLWLRGRLRTAQRGVALLDRKLRILRAERERFRELARRTEADWYARCREADRWLLRAALLGGQRGIRLATPGEPAEVTLRWAGVMGVRYPVDPLCRTPEPAPGAPGPGNAALIEATAAYRAALAAAVTHAAAEAANRTVDAEISATSRRLRAIADRWVPRLEETLRDLTERLEETERADTVRLRWSTRSPRHRV